MGCTPSKLAVVYGQDTVCSDLDTCSTFVPSLKSSVSTPEKPRLRVDVSSDQTLLSGEFNLRAKVLLLGRRLFYALLYINVNMRN